jgi:hypothetical protein
VKKMSQVTILSLKPHVEAPGVDFTKLFCQAKSCRRTVFGKKFAVQFHQQSSKAKISLKFAKICNLFAKKCVKSCAQMLMKSTPGGWMMMMAKVCPFPLTTRGLISKLMVRKVPTFY